MGMQYRAGLGTVGVDIAVHAPFAGRFQRVVGVAVEIDQHDIPRFELLVGQAGRGDQESRFEAHADVAGAALVERLCIHRQAGVDHLPRQCLAVCKPGVQASCGASLRP